MIDNIHNEQENKCTDGTLYGFQDSELNHMLVTEILVTTPDVIHNLFLFECFECFECSLMAFEV